MLKKVFFLLLILSFNLYGQHTVTGNLNSTGNYSWVLLYNFIDGKQEYVDRGNIENGKFQFVLKEKSEPGIYRAYYQLENNLFIEFIYNNEDIEFSFEPTNPSETIVFSKSEENNIYQKYLMNITKKQNTLDSLQVLYFKSNNSDLDLESAYKKSYSELVNTQKKYEGMSEGKMVHAFISSSAQNNSKTPFKTPKEYLAYVKEHFFDAVDFKNPKLKNSTLIGDKLMDFVLYLNQANNLKSKNILQKEAINKVVPKLQSEYDLLSNFENNLLEQYLYERNTEMVEFVLNNYYNKLPSKFQNKQLLFKVKSALKTGIGKKAPNFSWVENGESKSLYGLSGSEYYIVVFFSSGCPHCQIEIPKFHDFIKDFDNLKVIAIGLEDEKESYDKMTKDYIEFINILDLDKWDSKKAENYGVTGIPSYFVLDADKNIIAKPDDVSELKQMLKPQ